MATSFLLGFVEPSFVWSGLTTQPDPNNVVWFLMGDLLKLGKISLARLAHCETDFGDLGFRVLPCFWEIEKIVAASCTLYSSLIIVKSLQLRGRRQIAESRKYYLVRVIVFLWHVFSLNFFFFFLFVSHRLGIRVNSLHFSAPL